MAKSLQQAVVFEKMTNDQRDEFFKTSFAEIVKRTSLTQKSIVTCFDDEFQRKYVMASKTFASELAETAEQWNDVVKSAEKLRLQIGKIPTETQYFFSWSYRTSRFIDELENFLGSDYRDPRSETEGTFLSVAGTIAQMQSNSPKTKGHQQPILLAATIAAAFHFLGLEVKARPSKNSGLGASSFSEAVDIAFYFLKPAGDSGKVANSEHYAKEAAKPSSEIRF